MISVSRFTKAIRLAFTVLVFHVAVLTSHVSFADTIVNIDFDSSTDLQGLFNPDSNTHIFSQTSGGLNDSGVINSAGGQNTTDVWTTKTGYSITGEGDSYRLSAFVRTTSSRGFSGLGISTNNGNEPVGSGHTSSGIGYIATDSTVTILSSLTDSAAVESYDFQMGDFEVLFPGLWYHFELTILTNTGGSLDVSVTISNAESNGLIGSVITTFSQTGIVNSDIAAASKVHPYFSVRATSGSRFDRLDNLTMRLSGGPVLVPDPESDNDSDGELDVTDPDDDNDGVPDEDDTFPMDGTESNDNDNDGIGDVADPDDDNDGIVDEEDPTPNGEAEPVDTDGDGVPDGDDQFPNDPLESVDTDNDGVGDNADAFPNDPTETRDSDGDGVGDNADAFPNDASETADSDGDSVGDNADAFPNDASETTDSDGDSVGDNADAFPNDASETTDSDGDSVGDNADAFPNDASETADSDGDSVGDNADAFPTDASETRDSDGDGVGDNADAFPNDPTETVDTDGDGIGDNADEFPNNPSQIDDTDTDGDGVPDVDDAFDTDPTESRDTDNDGVGDNADAFPFNSTETRDTDGDGVGDNADVFPLDPTETVDSDGDGVGDNADVFPRASSETADSDGDGIGDNADVFPDDATETTDSDGDGVGDNSDAFPADSTESVDTDGDGVGDNADAFPNDASETTDTDRDGIGDNTDPTPLGEIPSGVSDRDEDGVADTLDAFPDNAAEWFDSDGDGVGNNSDAFDNDPLETTDSDNDGVGDNTDRFPLNANEQFDSDNDGIGDNADTDKDNDGVPDSDDLFPLDPTEHKDTDLDGIGNAKDTDDDNDGVRDADDAFPELASESKDSDNDGTGDFLDQDDDNDGVPDVLDMFPNNALETIDSDRDGIGDNTDTDDDNDGYDDAVELLYESDSLNAGSVPDNLDMDRDTLADNLERGSDADGDGIGNEFDVDSDNDGIFDLIEASAQPALAAALDTDNDGMMDDTALTGLTRVNQPADTDGDGIRDFRDLDSDNDGLSDSAERTSVMAGFVAINGLQNDSVSLTLADPDGDNLINSRDLDSDNDGIPDIVEAGGQDLDNNGITDNFTDINADGMDDSFFSIPLTLPDTDADGIQDYVDLDSDNDGQFDIAASGLVDADLDGDGRIDIGLDSNGNGILDYVDVAITNGVDSDADGIDDRVDASILGELDSDFDGIADRFDADTQGDGFIQIVSVTLPSLMPPTTAPAEPVAEQPPANAPIATTALSGGGCSVAGPTQPDITLTALLVLSVIYLVLVHAGTVRTLKRTLLLFLSTSLAAGPTVANVHTGLYLGIGGGASRLMPRVEYARFDGRDSVGTAWNATAGYQLTRTLGVELEYSNLGTTVLDPIGTVDYQDLNISGLYHWGGAAAGRNGKKYSLYGRVGVGKISNQSNLQLARGSNAHWLAGVGVQIPVSDRLSLRAEGVNYDADVSRVGLSLTYHMDELKLPGIGWLARNNRHTDMARAALKEDAKHATRKSGNQHYYLSADQLEPYQIRMKTVDQMMAETPAPKIQWLTSESTRNRIKPGFDWQKPALAAAMPESAIVQPDNAAAPDHLPEKVLFGFDRSHLTRAFRDTLRPLVNYLRANPQARVTLTGHTDNIGSEEYNQRLSVRRAEAVRLFLLQQGIDRDMIRILGAGEKRPVKSNARASGRKANRRVSIVVT